MKEANAIIERSRSLASDQPAWWDGKQLDEVEFCEWFKTGHEIVYVGNCFYDIDGIVSEEKISKEILEAIEPYVKSNLTNRIKKLREVLALKCMTDRLPIQDDRVHFANGTYYLEGGFIPEKQFCSNRLPVFYNQNAKEPIRWLEFLNQLLYPEDITTLQEFMGYCMIPTTKAQAMLILIGKGGEGKSRIGLVASSIFGDNMNICSIAKLSSDKFCRADQEGKLLMIDDDMQMEALANTNILKAVITMEDKMDLERKGKQSYQGYLYVRIMAFGNGTLTSLYDKSNGFYRRQIVINVKDKDPNRKDDKDLGRKLKTEKEGIALWALEGLKKLSANGFTFDVSNRSKEAMGDSQMEDNNLLQFMESEGYIMFQKNTELTTKELYDIYSQWCDDNLEKPRAVSAFSRWLGDHANEYGLEKSKNIKNREGKRVNGFRGVCRDPGPNPFAQAA